MFRNEKNLRMSDLLYFWSPRIAFGRLCCKTENTSERPSNQIYSVLEVEDFSTLPFGRQGCRGMKLSVIHRINRKIVSLISSVELVEQKRRRNGIGA